VVTNETPLASRGQRTTRHRTVRRERGRRRVLVELASGLTARPNPDASPVASCGRRDVGSYGEIPTSAFEVG
jgi:hypothetical protein